MKDRTSKTCCICGRKYDGYGNNPWLLNKKEGARCCDECNCKVIAARLKESTK